MADEFQLGSGNWWGDSTTRTNTRYDDSDTTTTTTPAAATSSTPLSSMGSSSNYGWQTDIMDIKTRSSMEPSSVVSGGGSNSMAFTDLQKLQESSGLLPDPSLQMMGLGLSSHNMDWNQTLFRGGAGKGEGSFRTLLQEEAPDSVNYEADDQWRQKLFGESPDHDDHDHDSSSMNDYKQQIGRCGGLSLDQQHDQYSSHDSSNNSPITTCQAQAQALNNNNFQVADSTSDYHTNQNHMLQATGFQCFDNQSNYGLYPNSSYAAASMHHNDSINNPNSNQLINTPCWSKFPQFLRTSPPPKQPPPQGQLQFSNNAPFWNAASSSTTTINDSRFSPIQSPPPQLPPSNFQEKSKNTGEVRDSAAGTSKKNSSSSTDASSKRARQETAAAMPAFKVRKEKMGDRITALQQLVSPFGKTDTASVLSEAIGYIKFLHEQVTVLSTSYMKNGGPLHHQQDQEGQRQDLRSRGLCLVPVSSTFPVTHESTVDYWAPTFGGTFR